MGFPFEKEIKRKLQMAAISLRNAICSRFLLSFSKGNVGQAIGKCSKSLELWANRLFHEAHNKLLRH